MDPSKEVTQKLAKLNIRPPNPRAPVPANVLHLSGQNLAPLGFPGQAGFQTARGPQAKSTTKNKIRDNNGNNNKSIKPTASPIFGPATGPITPIPSRKSSKNFELTKKPNPKAMKTISRNIAETLALHSPTLTSQSTSTTGHIASSIAKYHEKMSAGIAKLLRRDTTPKPLTGPSARIKQWLMAKGEEKERHRHRNRRTLGALGSSSRSIRRKKLGLRREGATLGDIKEEEEGNKEEDTVMKD
ncbi:hypothetical protein B0T20DRAFT_397569 [Sordaria brevicollis]|uniref:Uncharacterized protein n=1 Tax=Sordaria brevicollis TaxID=83679 RepID=A0AAE0NVS1_SORBR|nr:hypothetical protein B0T20DRAFT_397569 [Sordaria brevicollis]